MSTSRSTRPLSTRVVRTVDDLHPAITDVVTANGANFNYGLEFLRAYERYPIQRVHAVYYVEIHGDHGAPVAFAPCYVQGDPLGALGLRDGELALLSHVWHCSDSRLVTAEETTPQLARRMVAAMAEVARSARLRRFGFINVEVGSPTALALEAIGLTGSLVDTRYWLDLAGCGDEAGYLARLRRSSRMEYRRHRNRARDAGVVITHRPARAEEDRERLGLFEVAMERVGSAGYYSAEKIANFLRETPSARIIELTQGERLLAMSINFVDATRIHAWACGWVRDRGMPFSPYYVVWSEIVRLGFQVGVPRLEGGRRNGDFKIRFGMIPQPLNVYMAEV